MEFPRFVQWAYNFEIPPLRSWLENGQGERNAKMDNLNAKHMPVVYLKNWKEDGKTDSEVNKAWEGQKGQVGRWASGCSQQVRWAGGCSQQVICVYAFNPWVGGKERLDEGL